MKNMAETHDVVMVGAGPAALSAAIYTTREDLDTVLYERGVVGGLAAVTYQVDNYPGFSKGVNGLELAEELRKQAVRFGADIRLGEVTSIADEGKLKKLTTTDGDIYAKAILLATGTDYKKLGIPGEAEYFGRGVHYCATCDGAYYRDKRLVIVGGGNSAVQESIFLTRYASKIDLLVRNNITASDILVKELVEHPKITVHLGVASDEIVAENGKVTKVLATRNGQHVEFPTDGVFVFVGLKPNTIFLRSTPQIQLDDYGFIKTGVDLQTGMPGVFACGDVRSGANMQIASAAGEGATAALMIRRYIERREKQ